MQALEQWWVWLGTLEWAHYWAFFLLPLPIIVLFIPRANKEIQALRIPFFRTLQSRDSRPRTKWWWLIPLLPVWALLVGAAAGPVELGQPISLPSKGRDMLLSIDLSGSMNIRDMNYRGRNVNRLTAVQGIAGKFIKRRKGDRIGLVLFADRAYLQAPITPDRRTVYRLLKEAELGMAGQSTAIGDGIGIGTKHLMKRPADHRILILLTDGENTAGSVDPIEAARMAARVGIKIYTIGFGDHRSVDGRTLSRIANITNGRYFYAGSTAELEDIYDLLDELEPIADEAGSFRPRHNQSYKLLTTAAILTLLIGGIGLAIKGIRLV